MKIGYVARHDQVNSNDDEGAITYALERLGHSVQRLREHRGNTAYLIDCDFVLFHHWNDVEAISRIKVPKAFWNFDLVTYPDPTLTERNTRRVKWMETITPLVNVGFCTDGDWVNQDKTGKLVRLTQGADERFIGRGQPKYNNLPPILFTGTHQGGGQGREDFVLHMQKRWKDQFLQIKGQHGRSLADFIASSQICVAPNHPATDDYWSNRIYLTAGFGGRLLHPECESLKKQYSNSELVMYNGIDDFDHKIQAMINDDGAREMIQQNALKRTAQEHLYRHRCEVLVQTMKERCF